MAQAKPVRQAEKPMSFLRSSLAPACLAAFVLAAAIRLLYTAPPRLVNDSADYLSCAANLAAGRGFLCDVKQAFVTPGPARHEALGERPPAYPALLGAALLLTGSEKALVAANAVLGAFAALAAAVLAGVVFGVREAWVAGILAATCSILVNRGATVEPAALYAGWLALLAAVSVAAAQDARWAIAGGLLWAMLALTRGEGLFVGLAAPMWLLLNRSRRAAVVCTMCFTLAMVPYWAANAALHGDPFFSVQSYHLRTRRFSEAMWDGYGRTYPSTVDFLRANWLFIMRPVARNAYRYATALLRLDWAGAGLALAGLSVVLKRGLWPRAAGALLAVGVLQWLAVSALWSTTGGMPEPEHLASPFTILALPAAAFGIVRIAAGRFGATALLTGLVVATYLPGNISLAHQEPPLLREAAAYQQAAQAAAPHLGPEEVVASCRPWAVWWLLRRPVIFLPRGLSREAQLQFLKDYDVRAIVDWPNQVEPWLGLPDLQEVFRDRSNGVTVLVRSR